MDFLAPLPEDSMTKQLVALALLLAASAACSAASAQAADGKAVFDVNCRICHGTTGVPSTSMKKRLPRIPTFDAALFANLTDADIVRQITEGKDKMKPFKDKLTPGEIVAVAKYIRTLGR